MELNREQKETIYNEFEKLYDLAEELLDEIERPDNQHCNLHAEIGIPVAEEARDAAIALADVWLKMHKEGRQATREEQGEMSKRIRLLFSKIVDATNRISEQPA
jgi:hypothetical protein